MRNGKFGKILDMPKKNQIVTTNDVSAADAVPGLSRGIRVLELLATSGEAKTQKEVADALGVPFSSVSRIMSALEEMGYLTRDPQTKTFALTMKMMVMGQRAMCHDDLMSFAIPVMRGLRDEFHDTVALGVIQGTNAIVIESIPGTYPWVFTLNPGFTEQIHVTAPGKAILAYMPPAERSKLMARMKFTRYNERTITDRRAFLRELEVTATRGYAIENSEEYEGVYCVGAPILDRTGYPVAAIWITGPSKRVNAARIAEMGGRVKAEALRISVSLGYIR